MLTLVPTSRPTATVLDLLLDPCARRPSRDRLARMLHEQLVRLTKDQPMQTFQLGRVLGELLPKVGRLGYVRVSDYGLEELGVGERTLRDHVRLAKGLLGRPVLRAAFLGGKLSMSHVLLLLHLPATEDAAWVARVVHEDLGVRKLRAALKGRLPAAALQEREEMEVLTLELDPDPYVDWLHVKELASRLDGWDLVSSTVLERVVSNYVASAPLPVPEAAPLFAHQPESAEAAVDRAPQASPPTHGPACSCCHAKAEDLPPELRTLLPHDPRELAVMARAFMQAGEASQLLQDRTLERLKTDGLYRDLGFRGFRDYLIHRGFAPSSVYLRLKRNHLLAAHSGLQRAVLEGRLTRSKVDALQPLDAHCDLGAWIGYAQAYTCRRVRDAVDVALAMRAKSPEAWAARGRKPPQEGESLADLRRQAGLPTLEAAMEDLRQRLEGGAGVQTSSMAPGQGVQTSSSPKLQLRIHYPVSLKPLLQQGHEAACRVAGRELTPEDAFRRYVLLMMLEQENPDTAARGDKLQALERAGWRCEAPGCRGRCNLQVHHIVYRSQGGKDQLPNYVVLCAAHHLRHFHEGRMKVEGQEPATRIWDVGILEGVAYRTYVDERLVDAWEWNQDREPEPADRVSEGVTRYRVGLDLPRAA